jgi:hypothetical protein
MIQWRKSSRSANTGQTDCVELARLPHAVGIRDGKAPETGHLTLPASGFADLLLQIKSGGLDV